VCHGCVFMHNALRRPCGSGRCSLLQGDHRRTYNALRPRDGAYAFRNAMRSPHQHTLPASDLTLRGRVIVRFPLSLGGKRDAVPQEPDCITRSARESTASGRLLSQPSKGQATKRCNRVRIRSYPDNVLTTYPRPCRSLEQQAIIGHLEGYHEC
jgi:hypothetical protein